MVIQIKISEDVTKSCEENQKKHVCFQVLRSRLAIVLNLLITSLTFCLWKTIEDVKNPERLGREQPIEISAEVQRIYPNFKEVMAEKKIVISKVSGSQPLFGTCRLAEAGFQKLTSWTLSKELRMRKKISKSLVFSENFL